MCSRLTDYLRRTADIAPIPAGALDEDHGEDLCDFFYRTVAIGSNRNESIRKHSISPLPARWQACLLKDPELNQTQIDEVFAFLKEIMTDFNEQLELQTCDDQWNRNKILRIVTGEILSKGLAYRDLMSDLHRVPIPYCEDDGRISIVHCDVERIPLPYGNNTLFAYGLVPEDESHPPILLFRGTTPFPSSDTAHDTLMADTCPEGAGWDVLFEGEGISTVGTWLHDATKNGTNQAVVMGHSLAGSLTQLVCTHLARFVLAGYAYNSPGVSHATYQLWNQLPEKPELKTFNREKDWVSLAGARFCGQIYRVHTEKRLHWLLHAKEAHNDCMFLQQEWRLLEADPLSYSERGPRGYIVQLLESVLSYTRPFFAFLLGPRSS